MDVLNNVTAPDFAPTPASTIDGTIGYSRAIIDVQNGAIFWQVKTGESRSKADWTPPSGVFMPPGSRRAPVGGLVYGFRFWAAVPNARIPSGQLQAQVTVHLA